MSIMEILVITIVSFIFFINSYTYEWYIIFQLWFGLMLIGSIGMGLTILWVIIKEKFKDNKLNE